MQNCGNNNFMADRRLSQQQLLSTNNRNMPKTFYTLYMADLVFVVSLSPSSISQLQIIYTFHILEGGITLHGIHAAKGMIESNLLHYDVDEKACKYWCC